MSSFSFSNAYFTTAGSWRAKRRSKYSSNSNESRPHRIYPVDRTTRYGVNWLVKSRTSVEKDLVADKAYQALCAAGSNDLSNGY